MIPATEKKLRETKFFLAHLEQQERTPIGEAKAEHAEFYFNALVSAGRSVTFVLQSEAKITYDAWYPSWLSSRSEADRLILKRFNEERIKVVHNTGAELSSRSALTPYDEVFPPSSNASVPHIIARMQHPMTDAKVGTSQLVCRFSDDTEAAATDAARKYVALLEALVAAYVRDRTGVA